MKTPEQISAEMHDIALEFSSVDYCVPYVAVLQARRTFAETAAQQLQSHVNRMVDLSSMSISYHAIDGNPVDTAYLWLIDQALKDNAKYALCIEEDTVLPWDGANKLIATAEQYPGAIIVGVYYIKFGQVMISDLDEAGRWKPIDATPNTGVRRNIQSCGLGCALIPIDAIRKIKAQFEEIPLFCVVPNKCWNDDRVKEIGQDAWFYHLARKAGIETICDTSVQCLHVELATGKYAAHPDVELSNYVTNFPITERLSLSDRFRVSDDYIRRMNKPEWAIKEATCPDI